MRSHGSKIFRALQAVSSALGALAGLLLLILLGLTIVDVLARNVFGSSILGMIDISTLLLVGVVFLGMAQAEMDGRHVSFNLITDRLRNRTNQMLSWFRVLILIALGFVMMWGMSDALFSAISRGETTNDVLALSTWPAKLAILVSFLVFLLVAIFIEYRRVTTKVNRPVQKKFVENDPT